MTQRNHRGQHPEVLSTNEAREGVTGHNVRYVLGWSLGAAIVVMALIYVFFLR